MQEVRSQHQLFQELQEMKERLSELGQRRFGDAWERMRKNENRYRSLFEDASVGLWEEDWSLIREYLQSLRDSGVMDLRTYFASHPASVVTCLDLVRVLEVNRAALRLCGMDHKRRFCPAHGASWEGAVSPDLFRGVLEVFEGADSFSCELSLEVFPDEMRHLMLRIDVPEESRTSLERIFLSVTDVTTFKDTEQKLRRRLKFEEMIQGVSRKFLMDGDLDHAIEESLEMVGRFVGASRSYVFLFDPETEYMDNTHEWCDLGVSAEKENLQHLSTGNRRWWMRCLREKGQVVIENLDTLPLEAFREKEDLAAQDVRSAVVMAFHVGEKTLGGFVGFDNVWRTGSWDSEDLMVLRVLADLIGNALDRRESIRLIRAREERFSSLFNSISDAIYVYPFPKEGISGRFSEVNDVACLRLGYSREELLRKSPLDIIVPEEHEAYQKRMEDLLQKGSSKTESENLTREGKRIPVEITSRRVILDGEEQVITLSRDITDRRETEKRMEYLASHDSLTDLLNRKTMDRLLDWESQKCGRHNLPLGLVLVDIDDLDSVNLAYGNAVGDEVIQDVARILREKAGEKTIVGRYGGDRFLMLIPGERVEENGISERISRALKQRNDEYQDPDFSLSVSQGTADWEPVLGLPVSAALLEAAGKLNERKGLSREGKKGYLQERLHWGGN